MEFTSGYRRREHVFLLPINPCFGFHFAFYGITGTGKTRAAMNLATTIEGKKGLRLRPLLINADRRYNLKREEVHKGLDRSDVRGNPCESCSFKFLKPKFLDE